MMTPKEFLDSYVENFNTRNLGTLMDMYETEAHFAIKPGQVINGLKNIRQSLQDFIDMNGNLESKVKGVIQISIRWQGDMGFN
jgi:ketosteroid isomerase-like protein